MRSGAGRAGSLVQRSVPDLEDDQAACGALLVGGADAPQDSVPLVAGGLSYLGDADEVQPRFGGCQGPMLIAELLVLPPPVSAVGEPHREGPVLVVPVTIYLGGLRECQDVGFTLVGIPPILASSAASGIDRLGYGYPQCLASPIRIPRQRRLRRCP